MQKADKSKPKHSYSCGVLTLSDKGSVGEREDTSGPLLTQILSEAGFEVDTYDIIADQEELISATLKNWVDEKGLDLVVTTGGTGVSPSDVTPEATRQVIERELPGFSEAMRQESLKVTPHAMISRGICGIRGRSLIINLPGSKKAAGENIGTVLPALAHTIYKIKGGVDDCGG